MGVIKSQSIKRTILNYFGLGIAFLATFFIYSKYKEIYGLARFVIDFSMLIFPFLILGIHSLPIRFNAVFAKKDNERAALFPFLLLVGASLITFFLLVFWIFNEEVINLFSFIFERSEKPDPLKQNAYPWLIPVACALALIYLLANQVNALKNVVVPYIFMDLSQKIILPLLILLYIAGATFDFPLGILWMYLFSILGLGIYLARKQQFKYAPVGILFKRKYIKEFGAFSFFAVLVALGTQMAISIDSIMITSMLDTKSNGAYQNLNFIIGVILIPSRSIYAISSPEIAQAIQRNEVESIKNIYKKSSIILLTAGIFVFGLISLGIEDLVLLMPDSGGYTAVLGITLLLGFAKLFDMATSVNTNIILYSSFYRFNLYVSIILAVSNIIFNVIFIRQYGVLGAAIATCISMIIFNVLKTWYVYFRFGIQPFTGKTLQVIFVGLICFVIGLLFDRIDVNPIFSIGIKSIVFSLLFLSIVWYLKISEDINQTILQFYQRIKSIISS